MTVWLVGQQFTSTSSKLAVALTTAIALVGVATDLWAVRSGTFSVGLARQTPKSLLHLGEHAWLTPFIWGLDTGMVWSTYRVSFCSWLLLAMTLVGLAPPWIGAVYGLSFAGPLVLAVKWTHRPINQAGAITARHVQALGIGLMIFVAGAAAI